MPDRFVVIVTGSRNWTDRAAIRARLSMYPVAHTVVIHGDCSGADKIAGEVARELGMTVLPMPAQWATFGKRAGPRRNEAMARVALTLKGCGYVPFVEAFPLPNSKGTWNMIRIAEAHGWPVETWRAVA